MIAETSCSLFLDEVNHLLKSFSQSDLGVVIQKPSGFLGRTGGEHNFLWSTGHIDRLQVKVEKIRDSLSKFVDGDEVFIRNLPNLS